MAKKEKFYGWLPSLESGKLATWWPWRVKGCGGRSLEFTGTTEDINVGASKAGLPSPQLRLQTSMRSSEREDREEATGPSGMTSSFRNGVAKEEEKSFQRRKRTTRTIWSQKTLEPRNKENHQSEVTIWEFQGSWTQLWSCAHYTIDNILSRGLS